MRLKVDREKVIKYADKAFLGLAVAFLILAAALWFLSGSKPKLTYGTIKADFQKAQADMAQATSKEYIKETLLKDDPSLKELAFATPAYDKSFVSFQDRQPAPWLKTPISATGGIWAPYRAIAGEIAPPTMLARVPDPAHRVAPTGLRVRADMAYSPSGKEAQGILGDERFYVTLQFSAELGQQTQWSREAANAIHNPTLDAGITATVPSGYDVQVQQLKSDGSWTAWQDLIPGRDLVTTDMVNPRAGLQRLITLADGEAQVLYSDPKKADDFRKAFEGVKANIVKYNKLIFEPPFFTLAALPEGPILPFDEAGEPVIESPTEDPRGGALVPAGADNAGALQDAAAAAAAQTGQPGRDKPAFRTQPIEAFGNHLLSVRDAGKTFRYRVRLRFLNPIFGVPANLVDPKAPNEAWMVQLVGPWGEPSQAVTLPTTVRYYFVAQAFGNKANFTLYRWAYGEWYQARAVSIGVGDAIATERPETIKVKDARGGLVTLPQRMRLSYDTGGVVVVDMTAVQVLLPGTGITRTSQKVILYNPVTAALESRVSELDKLEADAFARTIGGPAVIPTRRAPRRTPGVEPDGAVTRPGVRPGRTPGAGPGLEPVDPFRDAPPPPPPEFQPGR